MTYTLRLPRPVALIPVGVLLALLALMALDVLPAFSPVVVAVALVLAAFQAWRRSLVLRVDEDGVELGRGVRYEYGTARAAITTVPWSSIREVVVISGTTGPTSVGVRLQPGAPLPTGARAIVEGAGADLRTDVPARFDRTRLAEAVAAHGGGVRLVDAAS